MTCNLLERTKETNSPVVRMIDQIFVVEQFVLLPYSSRHSPAIQHLNRLRRCWLRWRLSADPLQAQHRGTQFLHGFRFLGLHGRRNHGVVVVGCTVVLDVHFFHCHFVLYLEISILDGEKSLRRLVCNKQTCYISECNFKNKSIGCNSDHCLDKTFIQANTMISS